MIYVRLWEDTAVRTVCVCVCTLWICFVIHPQGFSSTVVSTQGGSDVVHLSVHIILTASFTVSQQEVRWRLRRCRKSIERLLGGIFVLLHDVWQLCHWSVRLLHQTSCCSLWRTLHSLLKCFTKLRCSSSGSDSIGAVVNHTEVWVCIRTSLEVLCLTSLVSLSYSLLL